MPALGSLRTLTCLPASRSITAWSGRRRAVATRTGRWVGGVEAWSQRSALAASAAAATPQAGTVRSRCAHRRRRVLRSIPRATAGHTGARSSAAASSASVWPIRSPRVATCRRVASQGGHALAWRATSSSIGAGSSRSMKASSSRSTSPHVMASQQPPQPRLELPPGVVEPAHDRALGTLQHAADLLVGEPVHLAQEYDGSLLGGQFSDGGTQSARDLGVAGAGERLVLLPGHEPCRGWRVVRLLRADLDRHPRHARLAALLVDAQVEGDAVDPGVEAGVALEPIQALKRPGERLLHHVERVLAIPEHPQGQRRHLALVALDESPKGRAFASPGTLDELPVARRRWLVCHPKTHPPARYSPPGPSVRLRPVGARMHVDLQRDPQRPDTFH